MILIAGSIQSIYADHTLRDGKGIFKDHNTVNLIELGQEDSKYQVHLLVEVRTAQGQLISITEASHSQIRYIGHEMLSQVIQNLGEKDQFMKNLWYKSSYEYFATFISSMVLI